MPILAYFLTWTTYGTWLPGDDRGWINHRDGAWHVPIREPNPSLALCAQQRLKSEPVRLRNVDIPRVRESIRQVCAHENWVLYSAAALSNHVHVVVRADDVPPERVMNQLKARASRALNEGGRREKWWTRHGSTRYIKDDDSLRKAIEYVENQ